MEAALTHLLESASRLSSRFGIAPLVLPERRNDNENDVRQLEAITSYLATLSGSTEETMHRDEIKYDLMSESDLLRAATERGLLGHLGPERDELVAMLRAADDETRRQVEQQQTEQERVQAQSAEKTPQTYEQRRASAQVSAESARSQQQRDTSLRFEGLSKDDILADAREAGMKVNSRTTQQDAIDFLTAAQGVREDQQAAMDSDFDTDANEADDEIAG